MARQGVNPSTALPHTGLRSSASGGCGFSPSWKAARSSPAGSAVQWFPGAATIALSIPA